MKTVIKIIFTLMFPALFGLTSCIKEGNHQLVTETREVSGFERVNLSGSFDVYVHNDSISRVLVTAEENLLRYIVTRVCGNELTVGVRKNTNLHEHLQIRVDVYTPRLVGVLLSGSGSITAEKFTAREMTADISGSGDVSLKTEAQVLRACISGSGDLYVEGAADESSLTITGSGIIYSGGLTVRNCYADISGSGDIYINVLESLDVRITGSGDVHYSGFPLITADISGSGKLIHF